ncbi:LPXTG cell wall anchor domain-containing protein [Staphylococcus simulans]
MDSGFYKPVVEPTPDDPTPEEPDTPEKQEKLSEAAVSKEKKEALPDTSETESTNNAPLFGGLFAALSSILLFGKRRKNSNGKQ